MEPQVTFVTPSFAGDLERFVFQRESMHRCGIDIPHVVVVDDEDVRLFEQAPFGDGLTVVSSAAVLPSGVEDRRRRGRRERGRGHRREGIPGWSIQQILKLAAAQVVDTDYVCMDSDNFWVRRVTPADFFAPTGELYLFEYHYLTAEIMRWTADSLRFLGVDDGQAVLPVSYVHEIIPFSRRLVLDLHDFIEQRHGTAWARAMADHRVIEYTTYGGYARYVRGLEGLTPAAPDYCMGYWTDQAADTFAEHFPEAVAVGGAKAGMVHSRLGRSPSSYRAVVERAWADLGSG